MGLRPTKGDESRGPGMPGPYGNAALSAFTPSDPVRPVGATHAWPVAVQGGRFDRLETTVALRVEQSQTFSGTTKGLR